ncbi:MAG TPA: hypothetical protein VF067_08770 [Sphingomicrobium sp.]
MSWFPRPSSPRAAISDLAAFMRHSSREQRIGAALAVLVTGIIVVEFLVDSQFGTAPTPTPTFVELYPANRTDADIVAQQKKEQADKAAAEKETQRQYKELEKRFGIE